MTAAPELYAGAALSGNEVVASADEGKDLARRVARSQKYGFPLCVEMEAAGIAICASRFGIDDRIFMLRGISDSADHDKNMVEKKCRQRACYNAAFFAVQFLKYIALKEEWPGRNSREG